MTPFLDETVKTALNSLTAKEVSREVSYAYEHEILWYGVHAVAHFHLMRMAEEIANLQFRIPKEELTRKREEFIQKYKLNFQEEEGDGFSGSLESIEEDGIFIPQQAGCVVSNSDRRIHFFAHDYNNRVSRNSWRDKRYARALTYCRTWQPSDLENNVLMELGTQFGRDMWKTCVEGFKKYKRGVRSTKTPPQPQKVTDLAEKLIAYYSGIIAEPTFAERYLLEKAKTPVPSFTAYLQVSPTKPLKTSL